MDKENTVNPRLTHLLNEGKDETPTIMRIELPFNSSLTKNLHVAL